MKNQIRGAAREAKGAIKEVAGKVTGNETLEAKGRMEKKAGKLQRNIPE
jgi:uncharacterized protein YjbJ (UPF0337 family)